MRKQMTVSLAQLFPRPFPRLLLLLLMRAEGEAAGGGDGHASAPQQIDCDCVGAVLGRLRVLVRTLRLQLFAQPRLQRLRVHPRVARHRSSVDEFDARAQDPLPSANNRREQSCAIVCNRAQS